jgi:hypothetical protein
MGVLGGLLLGIVGVASAAATVGGIRLLPAVFTARSQLAVGVLTALAAIGLILAPGAPTGLGVWDAVLRAALGAGATFAASRARRWAWIVAASLAALGSAGHALTWLALVALGLGVGTAIAGRRRAIRGDQGLVIGAVIGAATIQVLARLPLATPTYASAAIAAAGTGVLAWSGWHQSRRRTRRRVVGMAAGLGCAALVCLGLLAISVLQAKAPAQQGLSLAEAGLVQARAGAVSPAARDLASAQMDFASADSALDPWWVWPARLVPVAAQNLTALRVLARQGSVVAGPAGALARSGHASYLTSQGGAIDTARLQALSTKVQAGETSLASAESALGRAGSPWLVPPLAHKLSQLESQLNMLGADEAKVGLAARELPGLLGAGGPRRYLLVVQDPVELRGAGGEIGDVGVLTSDNGRLSLSSFGPDPHLDPSTSPPALTGPAAAWAKAEGFALRRYPGDASFAPDFPVDAQAIEQLYREATGVSVDGVISVDPLVLADMASVTGPVSVTGWPVPLGTSNLVPVLLHDQYTAFAGQARQDFLYSVTRAVFARLTSTGLSSPLALAHALAPAVATGHLLLYANRPGEQALFASLGATGAMPPVQGDFLEVVTQNAGQDKIDWYLRRSLTYDATYDPATGSVNATATITLVNHSPASGEPSYVIGGGPGSPAAAGVNRLFLSVYSPLLFAGGTLDGSSLLMSSQLEEGRHVYSQFVSIPPGGTAVVRVHLIGTIAGASIYHLEVAHQPTYVPDQLQVAVRPSPGWSVASSTGLENTRASAAVSGGPANAAREFSVTFDPG